MSVYTEELQRKLKSQLESCVNVSEGRIHTLVNSYKKNKDETQLSEIALRKATDETKRLKIQLKENEALTETERASKAQKMLPKLLKENKDLKERLKEAEKNIQSNEIKIKILRDEREKIRKELTTSSQLLTDLLLVPRLHLTNINVKPGQPIIRQYDLIKYNKNLQTLTDSAKNLLINEKDELEKPYAQYIKTLREVSRAVAASESTHIQNSFHHPISLTEGIQQRVSQIQQDISEVINSARQNDKNSSSTKNLSSKKNPIKDKPRHLNNNNTNVGLNKQGNMSGTEKAKNDALKIKLHSANAAGVNSKKLPSQFARIKSKNIETSNKKHGKIKSKDASIQTDDMEVDSSSAFDSKYRSESETQRIHSENHQLKLQLDEMQRNKDLEIANLKQHLAALQLQSKQDKVELKSKEEAIDNLNQIRTHQQQRIQALDKEKKSAYELVNSTIFDFETELQNALKRIETMHQDLNKSMDLAEEYLLRAEHAENESNSLQQAIILLNKQLSELQLTTSEELIKTQNVLNNRIHILEAQNAHLEKTLHQSQNESRTMTLEHEKLKLEFKSLNDNYTAINNELSKIQDERDRLLLTIKQLTKERNDARDLVAARDLTITGLTRERDDALALVAARDLTIIDLNRELNNTRDLVAARDLTITGLTRERDDAIALVAAHDLTIIDLNRELNNARDLVAARELTIADLNRDLNDARRARVLAVEELAQLRLAFDAKSLEYAQANNTLQYERVVHQNQTNELNSIITHLRQSTRPGKSY